MDQVGGIAWLRLAWCGGLAVAISVAAWWMETVTWPGSLFTGLIGLTILVLGGWLWLVPIAVFFVSANLLGRLPGGDAAGPEVRTAWQVLANGAAAWLGAVLLLLRPHFGWNASDSVTIYLGALAAANADTWATEIGTRLGGLPCDIVSGRKLPVGASGGITGVGTFGAALGALVIAVFLPLLARSYAGDWWRVGEVALAGWLGAMVDSFLGSTAQKRYRCRTCGDDTEQSEHCGMATALRRGFLSNNQVNWVCTSLGGFTSWAWLRW